MTQLSEHFQVILHPVLTEKSTEEQERLNVYRFEVAGGVNRIEIKKAVEAIFEVKVESVNTQVRNGKVRRRGQHYFQRPPRKIAIVKLKEGSKIELL
ncbi:MAG: 50S ribosomal protein L23 [Planctomycetota bacterium]